MTPQPETVAVVRASEATAAAVIAVAKALIEAASDFGEGNQIGGDVWKMAGAALDAALPHAAAIERMHILRAVRAVHRLGTLGGEHCVNCRFAWPCPTEQALAALETAA